MLQSLLSAGSFHHSLRAYVLLSSLALSQGLSFKDAVDTDSVFLALRKTSGSTFSSPLPPLSNHLVIKRKKKWCTGRVGSKSYMGKTYLSCHWLIDAVHKFVHMFKVFCHLRCQNHVNNSLAQCSIMVPKVTRRQRALFTSCPKLECSATILPHSSHSGRRLGV